MNIKKSKNLFMTVLFGFLILVAFAFFYIFGGLNDTKTLKFSNKKEAIEYIEKAWLPENIPEDAKNIILYYNIDTNIVNGSFESSKKYMDEFQELLYKSDKGEFIRETKVLNKKFEKITKSLQNKDVSFYKNQEYIFVMDGNVVYFFNLHK